MEAYLIDWLNLGVRWLHMIAGIAWIGASFYFISLDLGLRPPKRPQDISRGVTGELWGVHGGGFYVSQKFGKGPLGEPLSDDLHWAKWQAYTTWFSGMGLLAIIYWWGANTYLIDRTVLDLSVPVAIAISAGSIVAGWLIYNTLCKLVQSELVLAILLYVLTVASAWGYFQIFGARAAYIHVGSLIGTIMVWNVMFHIIPGQKKMVAEIRAGKEPDPMPGIIGKQRSVHNTYFTLPVLFIMISNHYPMTYGNKYGWIVLAVIMLAGALIRQYFVFMHMGKNQWSLLAAAAVLFIGLIAWMAPNKPIAQVGVAPVKFTQLQPILMERCTVCHAEKPSFAGFQQPPGGLMLERPEQVKMAAQKIYQQTIATHAMPIGNLTQMTEPERALLGRWLAEGARIEP